MLFGAYRELVHPDEAQRYWEIFPAQQTNVIPMQAESTK
jgi:hypothetical protein